MTYIVAVACVFGIVVGQVLFKFSALALKESGTLFEWKTMTLLGAAFALYATTTLAWVWVLQHIELGKVYPLMALAFVLVPIASYMLLGERFSPQYFFGVVLIMSGIVIAATSH